MLEEVVLGIGAPNFSQTLFACLRRSAAVETLLIYRYVQGGEVEVLAVEGLDEGDANHIQQYHALDGTRRHFPWTAEREMSVEVLAPADITDGDFRAWWRLHHRDSPRITIQVRRPDEVMVIDMFLAEQGPASVDRLRNYIAANARAISSAAQRHFELVKAARPPSLTDAVERVLLLPCHAPLSTREALVCAHIVNGYSNEAMALAIGISLHSVVTYRKRSYAKLRISSQQELFSLFFQGNAPANAPAPDLALLTHRAAPRLSAGVRGGDGPASAAIRDLQHNYCRVLHGLDMPFDSGVWHEDGLAIYDGYFEGTGTEFWRWMATSYPNRTGLLHQVGETSISVQGGYASSETPVSLARLRLQDDRLQLFTAQGRYIDDWTRHKGKWGLQKRRYVREAGFIQDLRAPDEGDGTEGAVQSRRNTTATLTTDICQPPFRSEFLAGARSISGAKRRASGH